MSGALRDEEVRILDYLSRASEDRSDHVGIEELQRAFRIPARASVDSFLANLTRKGYIRANHRHPTGFEILRNPDGSLREQSVSYGSQTDSKPAAHVISSRPRPDQDGLTPRQREAYEVVRRAVDKTGLPPSTDELREELGLGSLKRAHELLEALERKGRTRSIRVPTRPGEPRGRRKSRGIELISRGSRDQGQSSAYSSP
jgi:SOS-response transcriptional repressor LexA